MKNFSRGVARYKTISGFARYRPVLGVAHTFLLVTIMLIASAIVGYAVYKKIIPNQTPTTPTPDYIPGITPEQQEKVIKQSNNINND